MNSAEYRANVLMTEAKPERLNIGPDALIHLMGCATLMGEIVDKLKKVIFYGQEPNNSVIAGDALALMNGLDAFCRAQVLMDKDYAKYCSEVGGNIDNINRRLLHSAFGKFGESAELINALMSTIGGAPLDKLNFLEELGDADWYGPIAHDELGVSEECIRTMNVAKLTLVRYASKQFTGEDAKNRKKQLEREAMQFVLDYYEQVAKAGLFFHPEVCLTLLGAKLGVPYKSPVTEQPSGNQTFERVGNYQSYSDAVNADRQSDFSA